MSSKNPFAALDESSEAPSKTTKVEKKTEAPKAQPKVQEKPKTVDAPKTDKPSGDKPKPKSDKPKESTQDGFEQVGKSQRGGRARGSDRGARGGSRGTRGTSTRGTRGGGFRSAPRVDTQSTVEESGVTGKDVRLDSEKHQIQNKGHFRDDRTGKPREGNAKGTGRFHDHHLSGTGTRGGFKKRGGGAHNWGTTKDQVEVETEVTLEKDGEESVEAEEKKEEAPVDPKTLSEQQKKDLRKKRKEQEKKARKGVGKKEVEKKSDELSVDQVKVTKVDPSQKTFEQYQKEVEEKKKAAVQGLAKVLPNAPKASEKKEEKKDEKKDEKKGPISVEDLFKPKKTTKTFDGPKKDKKAPPKVTDSKDFPTLK